MRNITLALLALGCGGTDLCGLDLERSEPSGRTPDGFCRIVELMNVSGDERLSVGGECPPDGQTCIVTMPGENFRTWRQFGSGQPDFGEATVDLNPDGTCPATCE